MSEKNWTPGKWEFRLSGGDCCDYEIVSEGGETVAGEYGIPSMEDAQLMSAAKKLYEALAMMLIYTDLIEERDGDNVTGIARAALAKARGAQ